MKPFMTKHCKQGGALPKAETLCSLHVPRAFDSHLIALKTLVQAQQVSIIADETTDCRDHSILNVMAKVQDKTYLIDCVHMDACNHKTLSQAVIKAVYKKLILM